MAHRGLAGWPDRRGLASRDAFIRNGASGIGWLRPDRAAALDPVPACPRARCARPYGALAGRAAGASLVARGGRSHRSQFPPHCRDAGGRACGQGRRHAGNQGRFSPHSPRYGGGCARCHASRFSTPARVGCDPWPYRCDRRPYRARADSLVFGTARSAIWPALPRSAEVAAALSLIIAIGLWCFDADGQGPASLAAAVLQAARLLVWRPWRVTGQPGLVAIHLAYAWIPRGLGLNVLRSAGLGVGDNAVLHAWAAGAIGAMCLAVMASMARRQSRQAFSRPAGSLAMFFAGVGAAPLRLLAELGMPFQLQLAALCWSSAFLLFVASYQRSLGLAR